MVQLLYLYLRDNVVWDEEQEQAARNKVEINSKDLVPYDKKGNYLLATVIKTFNCGFYKQQRKNEKEFLNFFRLVIIVAF